MKLKACILPFKYRGFVIIPLHEGITTNVTCWLGLSIYCMSNQSQREVHWVDKHLVTVDSMRPSTVQPGSIHCRKG